MTLKSFRPTSPGRRGLVQVHRAALWKGKPFKKLTRGLHLSGGRDRTGRISVRRRGGGHKRRYRIIDFARNKHDMQATVVRLEYDPNRSSFIALVKYEDGEHRYILAVQTLSVGDKILSGHQVDVKPGNAMPLSSVPLGSLVHNVELKPGAGGKLARAAGASIKLAGRDSGYALLQVSSGEVRKVRAECMATIGIVSNPDHANRKLAKAGRSRWLGRRPSVRGVAMNPIDHPHGGGEGKTSGGRHPVTPWGKPTKGARTRTGKRTDSLIVRRRRTRRQRRR